MLKYVASCHDGEDFEGGGSSRIISSRIVSVSHEKRALSQKVQRKQNKKRKYKK